MEQKNINYIMGGVILLLLAGVIYLGFRQVPLGAPASVTPQPLPLSDSSGTSAMDEKSPSTSNTPIAAGMKLYRNSEYGFEFQYPKEWEVYTYQAGPLDYEKKIFGVVVGPPANIYAWNHPGDGVEGPPAYFTVSVSEPNKVTADYGDCAKANPLPDGTQVSKVSVAGMTLNKCVSPGMFGMWAEVKFLKDNKLSYYLSTVFYEEANKPIVDKIIASFKLTSK